MMYKKFEIEKNRNYVKRVISFDKSDVLFTKVSSHQLIEKKTINDFKFICDKN
jgi:hypothetical protein